MNIIENYEKSLQAIYDHVGFTEDWVVCPLDMRTDYFWAVDEKTVRWAETKEEFENQSGQYYEDALYTQRFYSKWVYEGEKYTMVFCDPHVDGMKWFRIFDNSKKIQ